MILPVVFEHKLDFPIAHSAKLKTKKQNKNKINEIKNVKITFHFNLTLINWTIPSGTEVLLSFCRYSIISDVCKPTLTAAYSEYAVSLYSWTWFGLHTGSAMATKKSWAYLYTGEKASKKMCPSGAWRGTRREQWNVSNANQMLDLLTINCFKCKTN